MAESRAQVEADDRAAREQMQREEDEHITQAKEEKAKEEAKCIEEQLKPILEFKQQYLASRKQSVPEAPAAQEVQKPEVKKTEPKKVDSSVGQVPRHSGEGVETTIPFGCPQAKDPNNPWFGLTPCHSAPSGHSASEESTPPSKSTPVTQPVAQPVKQPLQELEGEEPFQPFKGREEQDLSQVGAVGPGAYTNTGSRSIP